MLLGVLTILLSALPGYDESRVVWAAAAACCTLLLLTALSRRPWMVRLCGALALEEILFYGWAVGPYPQPLDPWHWGGPALALSSAAVVFLLFRLPLPEVLFPVRGAWLRRMLSAWSLLGIVATGPWWYGWWYFWVHPQLRWALVPGLLFGLGMLWTAGNLLVEGLPRVTLTRWSLRPAGTTETR